MNKAVIDILDILDEKDKLKLIDELSKSYDKCYRKAYLEGFNEAIKKIRDYLNQQEIK